MTDKAPRVEYEKVSAALNAAHLACFNHPDRHPLGMSHGPFSGVNVALGTVAKLERDLWLAKKEAAELREKLAALGVE